MKVLVLNGSPKGEYSITLQTSLYLEKRFPEHDFQVLHGSVKNFVLLAHPATINESP